MEINRKAIYTIDVFCLATLPPAVRESCGRRTIHPCGSGLTPMGGGIYPTFRLVLSKFSGQAKEFQLQF